MEFTLKEAREYATSRKLEEWVIQFVSATDKKSLAEIIQNNKGKCMHKRTKKTSWT